MRLPIMLLSAFFLLWGCSSAPEGKKPEPFAVLYVYRSEAAAPKVRMKVEIDGTEAGETGPSTCIRAEVPPGVRKITSRAENVDNLEIEVVAGKTYYVWQEVRLGLLSARAKLKLMTDEEGKKGLAGCRVEAPR